MSSEASWRSARESARDSARDTTRRRSRALTGRRTHDVLPSCNIIRADDYKEGDVLLVADKLVYKEKTLRSMPSEAAFLTENYKEYIHSKANRAQRAMSELVPRERMNSLIQPGMTRNDCVEAIMEEVESRQRAYPLPNADSMIESLRSGGSIGTKSDVPAFLRIERADVQAFMGCERANICDQIEPAEVIDSVYNAKLPMQEVNGGLNRALRLKPPPRERARADQAPRYANNWQAKYTMETIAEAMEKADVSNAGRLKSYKVFKNLDTDGDGFVTISDIQDAMHKYKIPLQDSDIHAFLTAMDPKDMGAIDLSNFTQNFGTFQGSLLDNFQKTVKGVYRGGGVEHGGPLQEKMREQMAEAERAEQAFADDDIGASISSRRAQSQPATPYSVSSTYRDRGVYKTSDVIKRRTDKWKPKKHELTNTMPPSRFGRTVFVDTRHITEPIEHKSIASHMPESGRFKTSYSTQNSGPDHFTPQVADAMKKHATQEFRANRIRQRQEEFAHRQAASDQFAKDYDDRRLAQKAYNEYDYERRVRMSCI